MDDCFDCGLIIWLYNLKHWLCLLSFICSFSPPYLFACIHWMSSWCFFSIPPGCFAHRDWEILDHVHRGFILLRQVRLLTLRASPLPGVLLAFVDLFPMLDYLPHPLPDLWGGALSCVNICTRAWEPCFFLNENKEGFHGEGSTWERGGDGRRGGKGNWLLWKINENMLFKWK